MADQNEGGAVAVQTVNKHSDEEQVHTVTEEEIRAKLTAKEQESLELIKGDVCQWLATVLDPLKITPSTFMDVLDTGIELCKLAGLIQQNAKTVKEKFDFFVPMEPLSCNQKAESGTFFARDNTSNFIDWCRKLGVEESVIFESDGLVLHKDEKRVILCLLDLARFAEKVGMTAPQLVRMEREIEELEKAEAPSTAVPKESEPTEAPAVRKEKDKPKKGTKPKKIDEMVLKVVKKCGCNTDPLNAVHHGNGKFVITGGRIRDKKTLYARILSDRIMVRVGGGWDTLDHFLLEHDPCRIQEIKQIEGNSRRSRSPTPGGKKSPSPYKRRSPSPYKRSNSPKDRRSSSPHRLSTSTKPGQRSRSPSPCKMSTSPKGRRSRSPSPYKKHPPFKP